MDEAYNKKIKTWVSMNSTERLTRLQVKYKFLVAVFMTVVLLLSLGPTMYFVDILSSYLNISSSGAVRDQENGTVWLVALLVIFTVDIIISFIVICVVVCQVTGRDLREILGIFWSSNYPEHWYKK